MGLFQVSSSYKISFWQELWDKENSSLMRNIFIYKLRYKRTKDERENWPLAGRFNLGTGSILLKGQAGFQMQAK
jgi:hypothetical protein